MGLALGIALSISSASGQTKTWSVQSGSWFEPTSWSPTGVPTLTNPVDFNAGTAQVTQAGGASQSVTLGRSSGAATGTLEISGAGVLGTNQTFSESYIGHTGQGVVNISAGGKFNTYRAGMGVFAANSLGTVTVDGAGSQWNNKEDLLVGVKGEGRLTISGGGEVKALGQINLGRDAGSKGIATVNGSTFSSVGQFIVGSSGVGELSVINGGAVSSGVTAISLSTSAGPSTATVDGANSRWTSTGFSAQVTLAMAR